MGLLCNEVTGERVALRVSHVFGRDPSRADTCLPDPSASLLHAVARWEDGRWLLRDHSRNGTSIEGQSLPQGEFVPLLPGQLVRFGPLPSSVWRVLDTHAPCAQLMPLDVFSPVIRLTAHQLLPDEVQPLLSIYQDDAGAWWMDGQTGLSSLFDGDEVSIGAALYRLSLPGVIESTLIKQHPKKEDVALLRFDLSLNEEHTHLTIRQGERLLDMGERTHHYALVNLARKRLADVAAGVDAKEQGWLSVSDLAKMLGMDVQHLNIQVFRARNQVMSALSDPAQSGHVVERRRGELRLGMFAFEVYRGSQCEGVYRPSLHAGPMGGL